MGIGLATHRMWRAERREFWQRRKERKIENKQEGGPRNWEENRATGSEALAYLSATDGVSVAQNRRLSSSSLLG